MTCACKSIYIYICMCAFFINSKHQYVDLSVYVSFSYMYCTCIFDYYLFKIHSYIFTYMTNIIFLHTHSKNKLQEVNKPTLFTVRSTSRARLKARGWGPVRVAFGWFHLGWLYSYQQKSPKRDCHGLVGYASDRYVNHKVLKVNQVNMGVSKNRGNTKWMVYNGKPY